MLLCCFFFMWPCIAVPCGPVALCPHPLPFGIVPTSILTIGSFDGVHLGHQALIQQAVALRTRLLADSASSSTAAAAAPCQIVALVFDPSPRAILRPGAEPPILSTFSQREQWLRQAGADRVERLTPDAALLAKQPEEFIADLCARFNPIGFVEGADFAFGKNRRGDLTLLAELGRTGAAGTRFTVEAVAPVESHGLDQLIVTVSSTRIRSLVQAGRMADAEQLLGRPFEITGTVRQGDRRGRTIGFPTANVEPDVPIGQLCLPASGVYAGCAHIPGRSEPIPFACNIGDRPTVGGNRITIEPHLINAPRTPGEPNITGLPEYGWPIRLQFLAWLRDQVKFANLDALKDQLASDCHRALQAVQVASHLAAPLPVQQTARPSLQIAN